MNIELRQGCTACGRSLKIRLGEVPGADFYITCPKCKADQLVRASDVAAAAGSTSASVPEAAPPPLSFTTPAPSAPDEQDSLGFGAQDLTDSLIRNNRRKSAANLVVEPERPSSSAPKVLPRNAPRTTPRPSLASLPRPVLLGGAAGGLLLLALAVFFLLWPRGKGGGAMSDLDRDIAAITSRYADTGAGGAAPDLFREGLELFRGDSFAEHREAADRFRRALVAAPHHPEPLAALALNSAFLPRSDRDGIGVARANVWADHVQRVLPDSLLGGAARAALLSSMGRTDDARELAEAQLAAHGSSAHAWFVLGHVQRSSDPRAAAVSLRKALELDSEYRLALTELAETELAAGRIRAAAEAIASRDRLGSPSSWSERVAGLLAAALGDETTALTRLATAVQLEPKDTAARLDYGWRLLQAGKRAEAAKAAARVIEVDHPAEDATEAQLADAKLLLAETKRRDGNARAAVELVKPIARAHPQRGAALYLLGLAQLEAGDADLAAETLRSAAETEPRAIIRVAQGMAFARAGHPEDAVAAYLSALERDPGEVLARIGLAGIYADADLPTRAVEEWERLLATGHGLAPLTRAIEPRFPRPAIDLSAQLQRLQRVESVDPNRDGAYRFYEAVLLCEAGRAGEGLDRVARIGTFEPAQGAAVAGCAVVAGRAKEALRLSARAETAAQHAVRGWVLQAARANGAEAVFRRALQDDPTEPFAQLGLAQLLVARGKRAEALRLLAESERRLGPVPSILKARVEAGGE